MTEERKIRLRIVSEADAPRLLEIYRPYVEQTAVTFEYTVPDPAEFASRIRRTLEQYPYLAAEREGRMVGYAYAGRLHPRAAYDWSAESSIYVAWEARRDGVGRQLYQALEEILKAQNVRNLYACIASPREENDPYLTMDSQRFHARLGYRKVGEFSQCAYKFGRWYDMVWMGKELGPHEERQPDFRPFPEIRKETGRCLHLEQTGGAKI